MFLHAEKLLASDPYVDTESAVAFLRIGTDFSENFYQLEVPLSFTDFSARTPEQIWPEINNLDVALADLNKVKSKGISIRRGADDLLRDIGRRGCCRGRICAPGSREDPYWYSGKSIPGEYTQRDGRNKEYR